MSESTVEIARDEYNNLLSAQHRVAELEQELEKLRNHIHNANKKLYGSNNERLTSEQIKFSFNTPEAPKQESLEKEIIVPRHTRTVRKGRQPLPDDLPRKEIVYEPEETHCPCCNKELITIGEERSEELEKVPAQLKVIVHVRVKKACSSCKGAGVLVPPLPPSVLPLERARPGAGLLADIIVSKYVDHLPLHRQEGMFLRHGIELPRQRMCDWVAGVVDLFPILYRVLKEEILTHRYIQADETTLKVQDGEVEGKCHTGYLWGLHAPPNLVWYHYSPSRAGEVPREILSGYQGAVQTDAYAGYNKVFVPETCERLACLAHVRRKFVEVQKASGKECQKILKFISEIYRIESAAHSAEARQAVRASRTKKIFDELFAFMKETQARTLPRSVFAAALGYALNQEQEIYRILESGDYALDNNSIERQMRAIAIGRKNYLFAGSHEGAYRAAVLYSLLNTCKLNKVNSWEWLRDVLMRVNAHPVNQIAELLPHRWRNPA